ncbi:MAG: hypothetical protein EDQ89_13445, partial [Acidobacteria bacterium]
ARWAATAGVALDVAGADDPALEDRLAELADPARADALARACSRAFPGNGAADAADLVVRMVGGERPAPRVRDRRRLNRWLRLSSHRVGPSLPLVAALGARDLARHPERRSPYLAVLAMGVPAGELATRLTAATADLPRERVLVLTDSTDFATLRRLGVAFELLPRWPDRGRRAGAGPEEIRARVRVLLAGRRPLRALSVGQHGAELLGIEDGAEPGRGTGS